MGRFLFGLVIGIILVPLALFVYLKGGSMPVAVNDPPFPQERRLTHVPLGARIERELVKSPPIQADETNLVAGAHIYSEQCAVCHGYHGKPSRFAKHMFPDAPPLWEKHGHGDVIGVSDDPPGETYWKVANGIRLTGMPAYKELLSDTEMWQVSMLLASADKPLPPAAVALLNGETSAPAPVATEPPGKK
jgi:thiosulfate dehydrogenase